MKKNSHFYHSFILITLHLGKKRKKELTESGKHNITLYRNHLTVNPTFSIINDVPIKSCSLLTLSLAECLMEFCRVTLTFESVDEIL